MKKGIIIGGIVVIAALCVVVLPKVLSKETFTEAAVDPVVEVITPQMGDISLITGLVGSVEPEDVVYVYPKAAGEVKEVKINTGDSVAAGQLLCLIDTKMVESAKSTLDSAALMLSQATEELARQEILYTGNVISEQAYKNYQDNVKSAQISYDSAKLNYNNQVSYSRITAPISGVVETCDIKTFDNVAQSSLVCVISGEGAKVVSFSVPERIKRNLADQDTITVEKDGEQYQGTIYEVGSMVDPSTGLFSVKARLDETADDSKLPTGSKVKLYVVSESVSNVITVPVDSVYYDGGLAYVYTYDREMGILHKVSVEVGLYNSKIIEIISGLNGDEDVLTTWTSELHEGSSVRLKEEINEKTETQAQ